MHGIQVQILKRAKYAMCFALAAFISSEGRAQTVADVQQAISNAESHFDYADDSLAVSAESDLYDYLLTTLPKVKNSLRHDYTFRLGVIRYGISADRRFRLWTLQQQGMGELGIYDMLVEYETSNGPRVLGLRDTGSMEYVMSSGGWCDTVFGVQGMDGTMYYMPRTHLAADRRNAGESIDAYAVKGNKLNTNVKLFRTPKKNLNGISYWFDFFESGDSVTGEIPDIHCSSDGRMLFIPLVKDTKVTKSNLRYEFDGKQFVYKGIEK